MWVKWKEGIQEHKQHCRDKVEAAQLVSTLIVDKGVSEREIWINDIPMTDLKGTWIRDTLGM